MFNVTTLFKFVITCKDFILHVDNYQDKFASENTIIHGIVCSKEKKLWEWMRGQKS